MINRYIIDQIDDGLIRSGKVLDLGCGPGTAVALFSSLGFEVEAVDSEAYEMPSVPEGGKITFIKSDIRNFDIRESSYDYIHARHVLHFLELPDIVAMLEKMTKGLKKGGLLYFTLTGARDGWKGHKNSKIKTFLTSEEISKYIEPVVLKECSLYSRSDWYGWGTTTKGIRKMCHVFTFTLTKN